MSAVDRAIQEAIARGDFSDLPGEGKPLAAGLDDAMQTLHRVLREQGISLPWIEAGRQIDAELEAARRELRGRRAWYAKGSPGWTRAVEQFAERLRSVNRQITDYNLGVPLPQFQRSIIDLGAELARLQAGSSRSEGAVSNEV